MKQVQFFLNTTTPLKPLKENENGMHSPHIEDCIFFSIHFEDSDKEDWKGITLNKLASKSDWELQKYYEKLTITWKF